MQKFVPIKPVICNDYYSQSKAQPVESHTFRRIPSKIANSMHFPKSSHYTYVRLQKTKNRKVVCR